MRYKTTVIIPAYNEAGSIGKVINEIPGLLVNKIVVVNNNSTDQTAEIAKLSGATVLEEKLMGYGSACLKGIQYLTGLNKEAQPDILVFMDGDYSDFPGEIGLLLDPVKEKNMDMVIGSRIIGKREKGSLTPQQIFGNWLFTRLMKLFYKVNYTDLGPFRAIRFEKLLELEMQDKSFGWTIEMQIKAAKKQFNCTEVPVSYRKRIGKSKISGTLGGASKAAIKIIYTLFKNL